MHRGSFWAILGPKSWDVYLKLLFRGRRLRVPAGDIYQLGGDVLIDPRGIVRLHHVGRTPADRPSVESLLSFVNEAARESTSEN